MFDFWFESAQLTTWAQIKLTRDMEFLILAATCEKAL